MLRLLPTPQLNPIPPHPLPPLHPSLDCLHPYLCFSIAAGGGSLALPLFATKSPLCAERPVAAFVRNGRRWLFLMTDGPPWYPCPTPASPVATLPEKAGLADVVASSRVGLSSACPAPAPVVPASSKPPPWSQLRIDRVMALARAYNWASVCEAIEEGFPLEEQDGLQHGDTLLHLAARAGQVPTIASALARGADPNVVNNWGLTPTCVAAAWGTPEALAALVAGGGDAGAGSPPALLHLLAAYVPEWDPWAVCLDPGVRDKMTLLLRQPCTDLQATWMGDTAVALVQRWRGVVGAEAAAEEALDLIHAEVGVV